MTTEPELDRLLDQIPRLVDRTLVEELPGGLTNRNYKVLTASGGYVVRCSGSGTELLGIDRHDEHANACAAAKSGAGPEIFDFRPDLGVMVIGLLAGAALENASFTDAEVLRRAAEAVRRLHTGPAFPGGYDMLTRQRIYRSTIQEHGFWLPAAYDDHRDAWDAVRGVVNSRPRRLVPCNNDLLAGNFMDDGDRVRLIDYEYSGPNDAEFELGNTTTECEFTPEMVQAYIEAYFAEPTSGDRARVRLGALCSEYGWSLWGFIQTETSSLDFDFHGWGMERYEKAARTFSSAGFERLLEEAADD